VRSSVKRIFREQYASYFDTSYAVCQFTQNSDGYPVPEMASIDELSLEPGFATRSYGSGNLPEDRFD